MFVTMMASIFAGMGLITTVAGVLYTQQINVIVNDFSADITKPLLVIAANIAVFAVLFVFAYKKKGLKG